MYKQNKEPDKNIKVIFIFILISLFFLGYILRLYSMQIVEGEKYRTQSKTISSQVKTIPAQRGEIFDRNATLPLVINTESFVVQITPGEIPKNRYDSVASKLAQYLGIPKSDIDKKVPKEVRKSYSTYAVKSNVPFNVISNIAENITDLPGVSWASKPVRNYVDTGSLSHIIGYVGDITKEEVTQMYNQGYNKNSIVGKTGIEKQYDYLLQGTPGKESRTVDVRGRVLSDTPIIDPPKMGNNLVLTIDSRIQELVEKTIGERVGASVVLKPSSGEVLAMVSYPYYDSNLFNRDDASEQYYKLVTNDLNPFLNRAVMTAYPPASTFKIVMSAAMLSENAFPSNKKIECNGSMLYGGRTFHCHVKEPGHGWLDLKNALAESCDVYYWTIGRDYLGIDKISEYARSFGLGQSAQIDLPSQATGLVPTAVWKERTKHDKWVGGDTMGVSIGQGFLSATPLQLADMVAMVSNKGVIYKPHLLKEVRDPVTNEIISETKPEVLFKSDIEEKIWDELQQAMRYVVTDGSGYGIFNNKKIQIAFKTGTGEVDKYKNSTEKHWHSWLVAYAPYDAPPEDRICMATIIEAQNTWEWWAPYATAIIINGIFENITYEESIKQLGFEYAQKKNIRME